MIPKFRAWDKISEKMFSVKSINFYTNTDCLVYYEEHPECVGHCSKNEAVLMQSTGLKDTKGMPIFEGDILEFDAKEWGSSEGNRWAVQWNSSRGEWDTGGGTNGECEEWKTIIGNIHENPELLK